MISKTIPVSTRIIKSCPMNRSILSWVWRKITGNWDNKMIKRSKSHCKTNTRARRKKLTGKRLWQTQFKIQKGKLAIWVRWLQIKNYKNLSGLSVSPEQVSHCNGNQKNISRRVDWEYPTYVRWNSSKIWAQTRGLWLIEEKT